LAFCSFFIQQGKDFIPQAPYFWREAKLREKFFYLIKIQFFYIFFSAVDQNLLKIPFAKMGIVQVYFVYGPDNIFWA